MRGWVTRWCLLAWLLCGWGRVGAWLQNVAPKLSFPYRDAATEATHRFLGNDTAVDLFRLLQIEQTTATIGARNVVYNISLSNLTEFRSQRIVWHPTGAHKELCFLKGKSEHHCHNYIRVGARVDDSQLLLCGTNAYKPLCRTYSIKENGEAEMTKETEGLGKSPYDPEHNSTAIYADGQLYAATVADFSGVDPLIFREPLRTERSDLKQLNEPSFVSSIAYKDYVLFFFREAAVEYINCGKVVYSRVARVCKNDKGGPHQFYDRWTSFLKSRLNCSVPGDYPFYFDEIQSTSDIVETKGGQKMIYAVFTTPGNSIGGSAVCAFTMDAIMQTFDGYFKEQSSMNSNWLRVPSSKVPEPRPGDCVSDSRTLPDVSVNFVKSHSLMDAAVPAALTLPFLVRISFQYRFTAVAVDPQVKAVNGNAYDVVFIGTDDGRIIKVINVENEPEVKSVVIEEIQVLKPGTPVRNLKIIRVDGQPDKLMVIADELVQTILLHRCTAPKMNNCGMCIGIQDPYCAWDSSEDRCVAVTDFVGSHKMLFQNIPRGQHKMCKPPHVVSAVAVKPLERGIAGDEAGKEEVICPKCSSCNPVPCTSDGQAQEKIVIYTADTLGMAVATSVLATLVVGFVAGYLFSRHYSHLPMHTHHQLNRLTGDNLNAEASSYIPPCANNKPAINLVLNVPPKNANGKNANSSTDNKPIQKVKKTYI
ncbi:semaphorin-1A [Nilaparvata lugens]|uniref:semaphorin-1A n=1 Tax=Nilaparvata lugens TaxID=108931 RepID=UPI00193E471A|nr:semaphorin-1A [Nilaparvata lugens]